MDELTKGTILLDCDGDEVMVMAVVDDLVAISDYGEGNDHKQFQDWKSVYQLKEDKYTVKGPEPEVTEITLSDVAEKLGIDVKKLRIKD